MTTDLRVLIVDDCHDSADILAMLLDELGCDVRVAYTPLVAINTAAEFKPNIAMLDIAMPGMDGYSLANEFCCSLDLGAILLLAVSGYSDKTHQDLAIEAGFGGYLVKPYTIEQLRDVLGLPVLESVDES